MADTYLLLFHPAILPFLALILICFHHSSPSFTLMPGIGMLTDPAHIHPSTMVGFVLVFLLANLVMTQVWHGVLDTLRTLPPMPPGTKITYDENGPHRPVHAIQAEKKTLDDALEQLTMLISLRRNEEAGRSNAQHMPHVIPSVQVSTPSSGGPGGSGVKRKRRTSLSYSASPAPTGIPNSVDSALNSPMPRGGTPGGRDVTHKRKDGGTDHPILMPGTKVAYRQPYEGDETWIQAVVKRCISVDKQKYEVRDTESGET